MLLINRRKTEEIVIGRQLENAFLSPPLCISIVCAFLRIDGVFPETTIFVAIIDIIFDARGFLTARTIAWSGPEAVSIEMPLVAAIISSLLIVVSIVSLSSVQLTSLICWGYSVRIRSLFVEKSFEKYF